MPDTSYFVISARAVARGRFTAEPGPVRYLEVPRQATPAPAHELTAARWIAKVRDRADGRADGSTGALGDVLIFVHGYNNDLPIIRKRQLRLADDLEAEGWHGLVVSFDWPSDDSTLNYLEDRSDAAEVAGALVTHGVQLLAAGQDPAAFGRPGGEPCRTNVHLIGHSTGAYVIMEAFVQAEKLGELHKSAWRVAQVAFIGGDVASSSLELGSQWAQPMLRRVMRVTNYSNGFDHVLAISNAKRLGTAPRVGRVGLPERAEAKCVDVDCSAHFKTLDPEQSTFYGTFAHSWHIGDALFARDLALTLEGRFDRHVIPTRAWREGGLHLAQGTRPEFAAGWTREENEVD